MKQKLLTAAFTSVFSLGCLVSLSTPALANGAASTRNLLLVGAAAATVETLNYANKKRVQREEREQQDRRQASYRAYFYRKHGYYPSENQFREWYYRSYGVYPM